MRVAEASVEVRAFWAGFVAHLGHDPGERLLDVFHFDDNQPSADELADLVLAGRKRATASLVWAYEAEGQRMPQPGDLSARTRRWCARNSRWSTRGPSRSQHRSRWIGSVTSMRMFCGAASSRAQLSAPPHA
jgi:hypothetical protein